MRFTKFIYITNAVIVCQFQFCKCVDSNDNNNEILISDDGRCGPSNNDKVCPGNQCCSIFGYCGTSDIYCDYCLDGYGKCNNSYPVLNSTTIDMSTSTSNISIDGRCGPFFDNKICSDNQCCSIYGYCGTSDTHCIGSYCQIGYGRCGDLTIDTTIINVSIPLPNTSTDGRCGPSNNDKVCPGNQCCSIFGYCGTSDIYCDYCLDGYGRCNNSYPVFTSTTVKASIPTSNISTDGRCGPFFDNKICSDNQCCSIYGYCGTSDTHCIGSYCQIGYGRCDDLSIDTTIILTTTTIPTTIPTTITITTTTIPTTIPTTITITTTTIPTTTTTTAITTTTISITTTTVVPPITTATITSFSTTTTTTTTTTTVPIATTTETTTIPTITTTNYIHYSFYNYNNNYY